MDTIPSPDECIKILKDQGCSEEVIYHSQVVRDIAVKIASRANADIKLVEAGALLHDIGRSKTHGIFHIIEGVKIGKQLGFPKPIINIIERHVGAGLDFEEAKKIGLPPKDYSPKTLEEKIVCHADNLVNHGQRLTIEQKIESVMQEGHKEYAKRLINLHKELCDICGMDIDDI